MVVASTSTPPIVSAPKAFITAPQTLGNPSAGVYTLKASLRAAYDAWAEGNGVSKARRVDHIRFADRLRDLGCTPEKLHQGRGWWGIALRSEGSP